MKKLILVILLSTLGVAGATCDLYKEQMIKNAKKVSMFAQVGDNFSLCLYAPRTRSSIVNVMVECTLSEEYKTTLKRMLKSVVELNKLCDEE